MLGSSLTYARRYSLLTILGLQAVDDDGNEGAGKEEPKNDVINLIEAALNQCNNIGEFEVVKERLETKTIPKLEKKGNIEDLKTIESMVEATAKRLNKGEK